MATGRGAYVRAAGPWTSTRPTSFQRLSRWRRDLAVKSRTFAMTNSRLNLRMCSPPTSESGRRWHLRKPALLCWGARARSPSAPTAEHPRRYADHPLSVGKGAVRCSRRVRGVLALRVSTRRWPLTLLLRGRSCEAAWTELRARATAAPGVAMAAGRSGRPQGPLSAA
jgi:hypothetical protein